MIEGDVQFRRSDIGFCNLYIMLDSVEVLDHTAPYNYDGLCFMVAKQTEAKDNWLALVNPLEIYTW